MRVELKMIRFRDELKEHGVRFTAILLIDGKIAARVSNKGDETPHTYAWHDEGLRKKFLLYSGGKPDDVIDGKILEYCKAHNENNTLP